MCSIQMRHVNRDFFAEADLRNFFHEGDAGQAGRISSGAVATTVGNVEEIVNMTALKAFSSQHKTTWPLHLA